MKLEPTLHVSLHTNDPGAEGLPFHRQPSQTYRGDLASHMGMLIWQIPELIHDLHLAADGTLTIHWKVDAPKPDPEAAKYARAK